MVRKREEEGENLMDTVYFVVPGEPVGQGRPRTSVRNGRAIIYKPQRSKDYERVVSEAAAEAIGGEKPFNGALKLTVYVHRQLPPGASKKDKAAMLAGDILPTKKPDLDNVLKAIADALTGVVWEDDRQVTNIMAMSRYSDVPSVEVTVTEDF
jgi:Holliday junction resolvase RusA-like endonuclease